MNLKHKTFEKVIGAVISLSSIGCGICPPALPTNKCNPRQINNDWKYSTFYDNQITLKKEEETIFAEKIFETASPYEPLFY